MRRSTDQPKDQAEPKHGLSAWQIAKSTLAAAFGVQTDAARRRDFTEGSPAPFLIAGVIFTIAFIVVLVVIVNLVLAAT